MELRPSRECGALPEIEALCPQIEKEMNLETVVPAVKKNEKGRDEANASDDESALISSPNSIR